MADESLNSVVTTKDRFTVFKEKAKVYFATASTFTENALKAAVSLFRAYSFEVFLVAFVVAISAFVLIYPYVALTIAGLLALVSGWVAYFGIKSRISGCCGCKAVSTAPVVEKESIL